MPWNDAAELVIAAGPGSQAYVAPVGTTLPTSPTASLNAAFAGLGYISEDGVALGSALEIGEHRAMQSRQTIRRTITEQNVSLGFALLQWNEETVPLAFGGGEVTAVTGGYRYDFPSDEEPDERSLVVDLVDGDRVTRIVIPRGMHTQDVEATFTRSDPAELPVGFNALTPDDGSTSMYALFSDEAAFAAGS